MTARQQPGYTRRFVLEYHTKRRSRLFALGRCIGCGGPNKARQGKAYCVSCAATNAVKLRRLRAKRKAAGLCYSCGKHKAIRDGAYCKVCAVKQRDTANACRARNRKAVLDHYGHECTCCGEDIPEFLTMDHIGGGGEAHRRSDHMAKINIWRWLVKHNFPRGFRTMCFNCNQATTSGRTCPHQLRRSR